MQSNHVMKCAKMNRDVDQEQRSRSNKQQKQHVREARRQAQDRKGM